MTAHTGRIPLSCVDKGLLALHSTNDPMVLHYVLALAGAVEPAKLRSALAAVMLRRPILRSTIRNGLLEQVRQVKDVCGYEILSVVDLETGGNPDEIRALYQRQVFEWMNRPLDPTTDPPWRVLLVRRGATEASLIFAFHHSATDGLGAIDMMGEVIRYYNGVAKDPSPSPSGPPVGISDELVALAHSFGDGIPHFRLKMLASLCHRFLIAPLTPNVRICRAASDPSPEIYFCQGSLTPDELRGIQSRSRAAGTTVNDILLAACFRTVEQWNDVHRKPSRRISIMVPLDIVRSAFPLNKGNRVSFISVPTTHKERTDPAELLRSVNRRTSHMVRSGTAFSIVYALCFCCRLPPRIPRLVARFLVATRVYLDSILLTNLGLIRLGDTEAKGQIKMGDAKITGVLGLPPVVGPMGISLCVGTYNGHLHVALVYKSRHFSRAEALLFLNLYLHEVRSYQRTAEGMLARQVTERLAREAAEAR